MGPSKKKRTHTVFRDSSAHRSASTSKPRFVGEKVPFADAFTEVSRGTKKFKQSEYAEIGAHPIVDQGKEAIAGYSDEENGLFTDVPAIVFGDHTRCVKYVEEPFFAGADGVKILKPKLPGSTRFWWHALRATPIEDLGYSRHFKLLKAAKFKVINETRQEEVVACLDGVLEQISYAEDQLTGFDSLVKSRFVKMFDNSCTRVKLSEVCRTYNGDRGKNYPSGNDRVDEGVPFVNAGHLMDGKVSFEKMDYITRERYRLLSGGKIEKGDILYCLRGSLGKCGVADFNEGTIASSMMIIRPDSSKVLTQYLYQVLTSADIDRQLKAVKNGSSQPNLSAKNVTQYLIPLPSIDLQQEFASFVQQVDKSRFVRDHEMNFR